MILLNLSQMLVKAERATTAASSSSTHRPKHFCGTLLASQHCSGIHKCFFRIRKSFSSFPIKKIQIIFQSQFYTGIPGHILLIHASVWDATPSHGAPPNNSSCSLNLRLSLTPSPQLTEHFPSVQLLQRQSTENKFWFTLPLWKSLLWKNIISVIEFYVQDVPEHELHSPGHFLWIYGEIQSKSLSISVHHISISSHFLSGSKFIIYYLSSR